VDKNLHPTEMQVACSKTRIGTLCAVAEDRRALLVGRPRDLLGRHPSSWARSGADALGLLGEIIEYLAGTRTEFTYKPVYPRRGFAGAVLSIVSRIPRGSTMTYGEVAAAAGRPGAARAVGRILNRNPVPLLVPCHRVVGKNWIGGYGMGLHAKLFLLALEGAPTPPLRLSPR